MKDVLNKLFDKHSEGYGVYDREQIIKEFTELTNTVNVTTKVSVGEIITYIENDAEIAMPINELMHADCRHLTKREYGHLLLKYLAKELRERFC